MAAIEQLYATEPEAAARRRIRALSTPFEIGFLICAASILLLYMAIVWAALFYTGANLRLTSEGPTLYFGGDAFTPGSIKIADVPFTSRLVGLLPLTVIQGALFAAFYCLHRLFAAYRRGQVFSEAAIRWMRRAGVALLIFAVTPGLFSHSYKQQVFVTALGFTATRSLRSWSALRCSCWRW